MTKRSKGKKDRPRAKKPKARSPVGKTMVGPLGLTLRWWLAICLILAFVGINLQWLTHIKDARYVGLVLIAVGLLGAIYFTSIIEKRPAAKKLKKEWRDDLAWRLLHWATFKGKLRPWLPVLGIIAIVIDLGWNLGIAHSTEFLSQDWTMWALGGVLLVYNFVPSEYGKERDFALIFAAIFAITMVLPMGIYRIITNTTDLPEWFVYYLLALPTSIIVNLTGAHSYVDGKTISFDMVHGSSSGLVISTGCAGLDSLFLFISGFIAFMLIENARLTRPITASLVIGIFTAYFANLLRMTIIVFVGVWYGKDAMLATHENAGSIIFLGWIALFWFLMYRFVLKPARGKGGSFGFGEEQMCANCGLSIDPGDIPEKCPRCGQRFEEGLFCDSCGKEIDPKKVPRKCPRCGNKFELDSEE
jgi:archaeosortase C (PEF-CTERM variant)